MAEYASFKTTPKVDRIIFCQQVFDLPGSVKIYLGLIFLLVLMLETPVKCEEVSDLMFVGDINLGRLVATEISIKKSSPWELVLSSEPKTYFKIGNLEGAAGLADDCLSSVKLCLNFQSENLRYVKQARFGLLGQANNHAYDLAASGVEETRHEVLQQNMALATLDDSPYFKTLNGSRYALVFINRISDAQGKNNVLPSARIAQALQLARAGADFVIVYIHWGEELRNWASQSQRDDAQWLIHQGADMIVGNHSHVIEPVECIADHPVWFSLGNHVFDQKYLDTHTGGMITCSAEDTLSCKGFKTQTEEGGARIASVTAAPELNTPDACKPSKNLAALLKLGNYTITVTDSYQDDNATYVDLLANGKGKTFKLYQLPLVRLVPFRLTKEKTALLMLVKVYSDLDHVVGIRPHVYRVGDDGIKPLWRGSGLAYPLIDAIPMQNGEQDFLCALHAGGSFLTGIRPEAPQHVVAYHWDGFGFAAEKDLQVLKKCKAYFGSYLANSRS